MRQVELEKCQKPPASDIDAAIYREHDLTEAERRSQLERIKAAQRKTESQWRRGCGC